MSMSRKHELITWSLGLSLALGTVAAHAADLDGPRYIPPPAAPYSDIGPWTGFHVGGTLGYGWGEGRTGGDIGAIPFQQSGMLGTIFAGYDWQIGRTVLGVEADVGIGDLSATETTSSGVLTSSLNAMGSLRARAGFLVSPALLLYGTAGLAWADMDYQLVGDAARSETFLGYQVGLGGEMKVSEQIALRLEYVYTGFDSERVIHSGQSNSFDPSFNAVRAGLSFKF
ncbi:MAG: outer membrane protein [Hyphomicrobiaceae bacterium]